MGISFKADSLLRILTVGFFAFIALAGCSKRSNELQVSVPPGKVGQNVTIEQRIKYAGEFSGRFKRMDQNARVATRDEAGKTLVVTSRLITPTFAQAMAQRMNTINELREMGFRKLVLEGGGSASWDVDLKN